MAKSHSATREQMQRVQVEMEVNRSGRQVKIRVEGHDEQLGWYTSGSLTIPLHQLPLLEQAVAGMRRRERAEGPAGEIIPFPIPAPAPMEPAERIRHESPALLRDAGTR